MTAKKTINNFRRNNKGISTVIATLLMIAIAVVASLVAYAWVMGYMNFTTTKTGNSIQIQSVDQAGGNIYVQNVGTGSEKFTNLATVVYVDGVSYTATVSAGASPLTAGSTIGFKISAAALATGTHTIKVVADDGSFTQITQAFP